MELCFVGKWCAVTLNTGVPQEKGPGPNLAGRLPKQRRASSTNENLPIPEVLLIFRSDWPLKWANPWMHMDGLLRRWGCGKHQTDTHLRAV
jgi:hypothetical protein